MNRSALITYVCLGSGSLKLLYVQCVKIMFIKENVEKKHNLL